MEWTEYKQEFNKVYNGDEDEKRMQIFESNKAMWGEHESGAVLGATQFSDLTLEEFQALPIRGLAPGLMADLPYLGKHEIDESVDSTATIDWVSRGAVTPVKDQASADLAGLSPPLAVSRVPGSLPLAALSACPSSSSSTA